MEGGLEGVGCWLEGAWLKGLERGFVEPGGGGRVGFGWRGINTKTCGFKLVFYTTPLAVAGWPPSTYLKNVTVGFGIHGLGVRTRRQNGDHDSSNPKLGPKPQTPN